MQKRADALSITRYATKQLHTAAYHEAGHAVVSHLMGIPFCSVVVKKRGAGHITFDPGWTDQLFPGWIRDRKIQRDFVTRNLYMTLSGPLAQTLHTHCWVELPIQPGDDEDVAIEVASLLYPTYGKRRFDFLNRIRWRTMELLMRREVWQAVETLANALIERRRLNGRQASRIICEALPTTLSSVSSRTRNLGKARGFRL